MCGAILGLADARGAELSLEKPMTFGTLTSAGTVFAFPRLPRGVSHAAARGARRTRGSISSSTAGLRRLSRVGTRVMEGTPQNFSNQPNASHALPAEGAGAPLLSHALGMGCPIHLPHGHGVTRSATTVRATFATTDLPPPSPRRVPRGAAGRTTRGFFFWEETVRPARSFVAFSDAPSPLPRLVPVRPRRPRIRRGHFPSPRPPRRGDAKRRPAEEGGRRRARPAQAQRSGQAPRRPSERRRGSRHRREHAHRVRGGRRRARRDRRRERVRNRGR